MCNYSLILNYSEEGGIRQGGLFQSFIVDVESYKDAIESVKTISISEYLEDNTINFDKLGNAVKNTDDDFINYLQTLQRSDGSLKQESASIEGLAAHLKSTGKAFDFAKLKAIAFNAALNMGVMLIASIAIQGLVTIIDNWIHRVEKANEAMDNAISEYDSAKSSLESINTELDVQLQAIEALQKKDKLTYVEKGQLEELQEITKELLIQQDAEEKKAARASKEAANKTVDAYKKQYGDYDVSKGEVERTLNTDYVHTHTPGENDVASNIAAYVEWKEALDETEQEYYDAVKSGADTTELKKDIDLYNKTVDFFSDKLESSIDDLIKKNSALQEEYNRVIEKQENGDILTPEEDKIISTYESIADSIKLIYEYTDQNKWNSIQISDIFNSEGIEKTKNELIGIAKTGELTPETIQGYTNLNKAIEDSEMFLENGQSAAQAFCDEIYACAEVGDALGDDSDKTSAPLSISETIDQLNTKLKPTFDSLKSAYQNIFVADGEEIKFTLDGVGFSTFQSIKSNSDSLNEIEGIKVNYDDFENFVTVLSDSTSTAEDVQGQFDHLASSIVNAADCTEISEEAFSLLVKSLKEMGLTNAEEVLTNIKNIQTELAQNGYDLKTITEEQAAEFINEANTSEIACAYLRNYMIQKQLTDQPLNTSGDVTALENLCNSLGVTGELLKWVSSLKSAYAAVDAGAPINAYRAQIDQANREIQKIANSGSSYNFKVNTNTASDKTKSSTSSGSKGKSSSSAQTFDFIETSIKRIESAIDKLKTKAQNTFAEFEKRTKNYDKALKKVTKEIDVQSAAYKKYMSKAKSVGLDEKWAKKVRNGSMDISEIKDDTLKSKIQEYQTWYEKAIACNDKVTELKKTQKELKQEKIEVLITKYEKLANKAEKAANLRSKIIDLKEALGFQASTDDYDYINEQTITQIDNIQEQNKQYKALQKTVKEGSEKWYEYQDAIDSNDASIKDLTKSMVENAETAANLAAVTANKTIENINKKDELLSAKIANASDSKTKNKYVDDQIANVSKRMDAYNTAVTTTEKNLSSESKGITGYKETDKNKDVLTKIKEKVSSGKEIPEDLLSKVEKIDNTLWEKCVRYNKYLVALEVDKANAELYAETAQAEKLSFANQKIQNVQDSYNTKLDKNDSETAILKSKQAQQEKSTGKASTALIEEQIKKGKERKQLLEESRDALQAQLDAEEKAGNIKIGDDDYQKWVNNINHLTASIYDEMAAEEDLYDSLIQTRIDGLKEVLNTLNKINNANERALTLQKAKYDLERAMNQRTSQILTKDGLVWQTSQKDIRDAQEKLQDVEFDEILNKIQDVIDELEDLNKKQGLYDENGNLTEAGNNIVSSLSSIDQTYLETIKALLKIAGYDDIVNDWSNIVGFSTGGRIGGNANGDNLLLRAAKKERVLSPKQNSLWEQWTDALPELVNLPDYLNTFNYQPLDYSKLATDKAETSPSLTFNGDLSFPNIKSGDDAQILVNELLRLGTDAQQYLRKR